MCSLIVLLMGGWLLVACSDEGSDGLQADRLRLLSATRADGHEHISSENIRLFVTTADGAPNPGTFTYDATQGWTTSSATVRENTQYYFYGFWPADAASATSTISASAPELAGNYSKGADLTLYDLPPFSDKDICVVVGVKKVESTEPANAEHTTPTEGSYGFFAGMSGTNYVNLLMDHLYTQLQLQFCVDSEYYALRRIVVKKVSLTTSFGKTVNATVRLRAGNSAALTGAGLVDYETGTPGEQTYALLKETDTQLDLVEAPAAGASTPAYSTVSPIYCPHRMLTNSGEYLSVETTYDVYTVTDAGEKGRLVRENCVAQNKIQTNRVGQPEPGMRMKFTLTVEPTYLYVLADPDLDNPTVVVKSE